MTSFFYLMQVEVDIGSWYFWFQDPQMNVEEVEEALRIINGQLLTDKEMQFIYNVGNINV